MRRILILCLFLILSLLICGQLVQAQVTLILNTPPQLPERVNDWERLNALFSVTVTNTGGTPLNRLRVAATVTNLDNNVVLFRTKNDLTRPFNAPPRMPQTLTAPQILPANSFEYDASVQTALIRTNTLPEGAYRLCVRVIDERGATLGMEQCRTFNVIIPDPPSLISPVNGDSVRRMAPSVPYNVQFQWTQVFARFGQQSKYKLRIVPIFQGQQPRQALEGNPVLLEKIVPTSSYQVLPSDPQFSNYPNATGFAWQVQAIDPNDVSVANVRSVGRNFGKSEIFTFGVPVPQSYVTSGEVLGPGSEITIGKFTLKLGQNSEDVKKNTNDGTISGKGTIEVKWLGASINVEFNSITVEKEDGKQVVTKGEVYSTVAAPMKTFKEQLGDKANLPNIPDNLNLSLGLDGSNLKKIHDDAKQAIGGMLKGAVTLPIGYQMGGPATTSEQEKAARTIALVGMKFTPTLAAFNTMTRIPMPSLGADAALALGTANVRFSPDKPDIQSFKLYLMEDLTISKNYNLTFKAPTNDGNDGTSILFENLSLKVFNIAGTVSFPTGWFKKINNGTVTEEAVSGSFSSTSTGLSSWIIEASIPDECAITKLPDFKMKIEKVSFDMSETKNPDGLTFPPEYPNGVDWCGFAIQKATLTLPPYLKKFNFDSPLTLELSNFLIDGNGLSGTTQMAQKIDNLNFGGFKGSLETFKLSFVKMSPKEVALKGALTLPVGDATIGVIGTYAEGKGFSMAANLDTTTTFKLGSAGEFTLYGGNSPKAVTVAFDKDNGATASLSGTLTLTSGIGGNVQGTEMSFKGVAFEGVKLSPQASPAFGIGTWGYVNGDGQVKPFGIGKDEARTLTDEELANYVSDEVERRYAGGERLDLESASLLAPEDNPSKGGIGGFPIEITELTTGTDPMNADRTLIGIGLQLNLDGKEENSELSGTTSFDVSFVAKTATKDAPMSFSDVDMEMKGIGLNATLKGVVKLVGTIEFYSNKTVDNINWGSGFYGAIDVSLIALGDKVIQSAVQFGSLKTQRYWFVDVNYLDKQFPMITVGGLGLYGLGGCVYSNMKPLVMPSEYKAQQQGQTMSLGKTFSGMTLQPTPDGSSALGGSIKVMLGTVPSPVALNGDVLFGITFENNAFKEINITGNINMMTEIGTQSNMAFGTANFRYGNKVFDGTMGFTVLVPPDSGDILTVDGGGGSPINGVAPTPKLKLHFSLNSWYIKLGEPDNPISARLFNIANSDAYLMLGNNLPNNSTFLDQQQNSKSYRELGLTSNASGIAFGYRQTIETGKQRFLIFYAQLSAGMGFEVMVKNTKYQCQGYGTPGINGWIVDGKVALWLKGDAGVYIDTWFYTGDASFLTVNAEAELNAVFPSPSWVGGNVKIGGSVLDGLLSFETDFPFEFGTKCKPLTNPTDQLKDYQPIGDLRPAAGATDVSTYAIPSVAFNQATEFSSYVNSNGAVYNIKQPDGSVARFRFICNQGDISLDSISNGVMHYVSVKRSNDPNKKFSSIEPEAELNPYCSYRLTVNVRAELYDWGNNTWKQAKYSDGKEAKFDTTLTFTTGPASLAIPPNKISSMTPMNLERYFLPKEEKLGRINFNQKLKGAFSASGKYVARFTDSKGIVKEAALTYTKDNGAVGNVYWTFPPLANSTIYILEIVSKASAVNTGNLSVDNNSKVKSLSLAGKEVGKITSLQSKFTGGSNSVITSPNDKIVGTYFFRTSKFNTFAEKIKTFRPQITEGNAGNGPSLAKNLCPSQYYGGLGRLRYFTRVGNWPPNFGEYAQLKFPLSTLPYEVPPMNEFTEEDKDSYQDAMSDIQDLAEAQKNTPAGWSQPQAESSGGKGILYSCTTPKTGSPQSKKFRFYSLPYRLSLFKAITQLPAPHPLSLGAVANGVDFKIQEPFDELEVKDVAIGFQLENATRKWQNSTITYLNPAQKLNIFAGQSEPKTAQIRVKATSKDAPELGDYTIKCFRASTTDFDDKRSISYRTVVGDASILDNNAYMGDIKTLCPELNSIINDPTQWDFGQEYEYTTPYIPLGTKKEDPKAKTLAAVWGLFGK